MTRLDDRGLPLGYPFKEEWEITPRACQQRDDLLILDVRQPDEVAVAGIDGALHIPLGELALRIDELGDDDDRPIATLCHHGQRALQAAILLRQYGFDRAVSIAGGIDVWSVACDASVPRYVRQAGTCCVIPADAPLKS